MAKKEVSTSSSSGIGFTGLLTVLFVYLKLTHVIAWSWWWVCAPIWISVGIFFGFLLFIGICAVGIELLK